MKILFALSLVALTLSACGKNKDNLVSNLGGITETAKCTRSEPIADDTRTRACSIKLVSPAPCEEIDLTDPFKTVRFTWENEGTDCQTEYTAYIGGNPVTRDDQGNFVNTLVRLIPASFGVVDKMKGEMPVKARDLVNLTSTDGTFEWVVTDKNGAHPISQIFKVKR